MLAIVIIKYVLGLSKPVYLVENRTVQVCISNKNITLLLELISISFQVN